MEPAALRTLCLKSLQRSQLVDLIRTDWFDEVVTLWREEHKRNSQWTHARFLAIQADAVESNVVHLQVQVRRSSHFQCVLLCEDRPGEPTDGKLYWLVELGGLDAAMGPREWDKMSDAAARIKREVERRKLAKSDSIYEGLANLFASEETEGPGEKG